MNKSRLEAFSDGVLAIIITIMVLEIKTPHTSNWSELYSLIPIFSSYFLSFIFVGIYWGNHHHLLHTVKQVTGGVIWSNLNLLFWLSLIPFTTAWMGVNHFASNTVAVYAISLLICGFSFNILQIVVKKNSKDNHKLHLAYYVQNIKGIVSLIAYSISIPIAFYNPLISGIIFLIVALMWLIPDKNLERALKDD